MRREGEKERKKRTVFEEDAIMGVTEGMNKSVH